MSNKTEIIIDGNNKGAITAINGVKQDLNSLGNTVGGPFKNAMSSLSGMMSFAVVGTGVAALARLAKQAIDTADELYMMSQKIGISVESLSVLKYAADQSGLNVEQLQGSIKKLSTNLYDVAHGQGKDAALAFDELGISALDMNGKAKQSDQILLEVADKFSLMSDGTEKSALALKLFGKAGLEIIPFLNEGSAGISSLTEEAKALGLQISTETGAAAEQFNDSLARLNAAIDGMAYQSLPKILDFFTGAIDGFTQMNEAAKNSADWMDFWSNMYVNSVIAGSKMASDSFNQAMAEAVELAKTQALDKIKGMGLDSIRSLVSQTQNIIKSISAGAPYADQKNDIAQLTAQLNVYTNALKPATTQTQAFQQAMYDAFGHPIDKDGNLTNNIKYIEALMRAQTMGGYDISSAGMNNQFSMSPVTQGVFDPIKTESDDLLSFWQSNSDMMASITDNTFGRMASTMQAFYQMGGSSAKKYFAIYKAFAKAQAIVSGINAVMGAYADGNKYGGPILGGIYAAVAAAFSASQIAAISSASMGSGSMSSGVGSSVGSQAISNDRGTGDYTRGQNVTYNIINLNGGILGDAAKIARELVPHINSAVSDGVS